MGTSTEKENKKSFKLKILICFGTRPEAIKMAPIILELQKREIPFKICVTAQHREMLDQVLAFFEIIPTYDLDLMQKDQSLNSFCGRLLLSVDEILEREKPQIVLVHGDTSSSSILALAAFHRGIKVGHVEAGLRTYNKEAPFPEEINRQITARIADYHFAPTKEAAKNLLNEQIPAKQIYITGNTVVDALKNALLKIETNPLTLDILNIQRLLAPSKKTILVTGHRRENFGKGLEELCESLIHLAVRKDVEIIYPVHLNPNVQDVIYNKLGNIKNIHLTHPVSYPTMIWLMKNCTFIISDSGGIQEEAPAFSKTVLVTRIVSERMEGVNAGFSKLVGTDKNKIISEAEKILENPPNLARLQNPYGDGKAAARIIDILVQHT